ncbi:MAG: type I-U CRISPR-associated RAMP protein Csb1/Cas7u, partial [Planctomycetota bacterium]|nr:type I-U CRISPR-associated RAMP protein Csb1/Cas7u [Planctomycetota bacterium]
GNDPSGNENLCIIDSVGSQANRIEPVFGREPYRALVPQIRVKAGEREISILDAGHRAGDAIMRCTKLQEEIRGAFQAVQKGDATALARVAPTSLVFGVWDSRDTQAKMPRLLASTIRAYNVKLLTRGAQFNPAMDYVAAGMLEEAADKAAKDAHAKRGFTHVPSSGAPGGIIASGGIRRDATLNIAALRLLKAGTRETDTLKLRRYVLGLALVALTHPSAFVGYLRQGCTLVLDPEATPAPRELSVIHPDGHREPLQVTNDEALAFAKAAASDFGIAEDRIVEFEKAKAAAELADSDKPGKKAKKVEKA